MKKRLLALVMALVLLVPVFLVRGAAATSLPASIYLQQEGSTTCTLSSATMMLRARAYLSGNDSWSSITESAVRPKGWKEGSGLYYSFKYTFGQSSIQVSHSTTSGISVASLKSLLNSHPEGIVFYCGKLPHAVFLTDYEGDTFYCADPLSGYSGKRIPLASSWLGKKYGSQANVLKNATAYWYVSSYNIDGNSFKYPTDNYADIGTDFTAVILNKTAWKPIENCYTEGEKPAVKIAKETGYANQVWYFVRQDDGSYKISSCYDGKYLDVRDASMATCAVIQTCVDSGSDAQKWYIYEENGGYILKSKLNGYVIDLVNNDSANGTHIQTYEYNGTDAQIWAIYKGKESALSAPTLSVTTSDSKGETKFTWNEVYGESHYDVKIWKNKAWEGDAYHIQWGAKSGYSLNLPAGTYQAYVDAVNYYQCIPSNVVTFTIQEHKCTNSSVVTKPTCTEKGYTTYTCKSCGTSFKGDYTNALGHDYSYKVTTKPTTSVAGVITGTCSRCKGTTTVQLPKLNTTDYTYKVQTAATCTKDGTGNYTWKNTSYGTFSFDVVIPKTGHTYTSRVVEPSCTHEGYTKYTCSCGDTYTQNQIAALGHQWGDGTVTKEPTEEAEGQMMYLCTREGCIDFKVETIAKLEHTHKYTETVTAPTCTEKGYTTHTCACGHSYVDGETAALGHAWDDGKVTKEPTEDAEGEKVYSCTRSGCSETKTEAVPPITHIHQYTEAVVAPTCVEKGYTTHTCACGDSYTSDYIDALGHDYKSTVTDPTCTEGGYTVHTCSNCNDSYTDSNTEAIGHSWDEGKVTTEPTEETEGVKTYTCMRCGETKTDAVPKLDHTHSYTETVTAPTCTEKGYSTYTCGCGDSYTDNEVAALGHSWNEGTVTKEPTENTEGEKTFTCTRNGCGETKTEVIPKLTHTHNYSEKVTAPTCTEKGYTTYTCACGDSYTDNEVAALGHSWDEGKVTTEPTEEAGGVKTYTCMLCGETKTDAVPKLDHTHSYTETVTAPTCTEKGYSTYTCGCGDSYTDNETAALGHSWENGKCTVCGVSDPSWVEPTEPEETEPEETEPEVTEPEETEPEVTEPEATEPEVTEPEETEPEVTEPEVTEPEETEPEVTEPEVTEPEETEPESTEPEEGEIIRLAGDSRFDTALAVADQLKEELGVDGFDAVIVASGTNFADALSGSYLAAVKNAPILLSCNDDFNPKYVEKYNGMVVEYVRDNLRTGGTVYILGGPKAVTTSLDEALNGYNVKRLAGANRYETNIRILEEAGVDGKDVLICNGEGFADSLSASATELPILLVNSKYGVFDVQRSFLDGVSEDFYVIGGESAVSVAVEEDIRGYGNVTRIGGKDRFETSVLIAETFFEEPESAVLAYAWNFPDGLCGGPLAAAMDAPLILTMTKRETAAAEYVQGMGIRNGAILGGTGLISDGTVNSIFG